jgi:hypothetical protein
MGKLLILTCGQIALLVVNVICEDFAGLTVINEVFKTGYHTFCHEKGCGSGCPLSKHCSSIYLRECRK